MTLFFQLLIGHALADFVLQSDTMARAKDRHSDFAKGLSESFPPWYYWLGAHALVHGGAVYLLTGSALFGLIEVVLHAAIDCAKCETVDRLPSGSGAARRVQGRLLLHRLNSVLEPRTR